MPVKSFAPSDLFVARVEKYRARRELPSWSAALVELAAIGMHTVGVIEPEDDRALLKQRRWGGPRKPRQKKTD